MSKLKNRTVTYNPECADSMLRKESNDRINNSISKNQPDKEVEFDCHKRYMNFYPENNDKRSSDCTRIYDSVDTIKNIGSEFSFDSESDENLTGPIWQGDHLDAGAGNDHVNGYRGNDTVSINDGDSLVGWTNEDSHADGTGTVLSDDKSASGDYGVVEQGNTLALANLEEEDGIRPGASKENSIKFQNSENTISIESGTLIYEKDNEKEISGANNIEKGNFIISDIATSQTYHNIDNFSSNNYTHRTNISILQRNDLSVVSGTLNDDDLRGAIWLDDYIDAGDGNDNVNGRWGNDTILGGDGNDSLFGWAGQDILAGGIGDDSLDGGYGNDDLRGGEGDDSLKGGGDDDLLDGGGGVDTAIFGGNQSDYRIEKDGDTVIVKALGDEDSARHGLDRLKNIEFLKFSDVILDVDEIHDQKSNSVNKSKNSDISKKNKIVSREIETSEIVNFSFENNTDSQIGAAIRTFGHVFIEGDVFPDQYLMMDVDGELAAVQMDVKATHDDGSVRHAVLSVEAPSMAAGETKIAALKVDEFTPAYEEIDPSDLFSAGYDVKIEIEQEGTSLKSIDLGNLLIDAIADESIETWLSGPLTSEFRVETAISDHLQLKADIRIMADGSFSTDVIIANEWAFMDGIDTFVYDVRVIQDGDIVYFGEDIQHHRNSSWHRKIHSDGDAKQHIVRDVDYMIATGSLISYDTTLGMQEDIPSHRSSAESEITKYYTQYQTDGDGADFNLFDFGFYEPYMPAPGGRDDLGFSPRWVVNYLMSQDERAEEIMLAQADIGGHIPWYFRDNATGEPVSIDEHEKLSFVYGDRLPYSTSDRVGGDPESKTDGWSIDSSHQPEAFYVPYLITGDRFYLDGLKMQANWNLLDVNYQERGESDGIVYYDQVRGAAWALRTIGNAAWIAPDNDAMKSYFNEKLNNNIEFITDRFLGGEGHYNHAGMLEGYLEYRQAEASPWMEEFAAQVFSVFATRGVEGAAEIVDWQMNYLAGRFTADDLGFPSAYGTAYKNRVSDIDNFVPRKSAESKNDGYLTTWEETFAETFGPDGALADNQHFKSIPNDQDFAGAPYYESSGQSYTAISRGTMAAALSIDGDNADIAEAYILIVSGTEEADYSLEATFGGINPVLKDGTILRSSNIHVLNADQEITDDVFWGTDSHELIAGKGGSDTLHGMQGIDFLGGGNGDDSIFGGEGDDYLFGNQGDDTLYGEAGDDILRGNIGADIIYGGSGDDTLYADSDDKIVDGGLGFDKLSIQAWRSHSFDLGDGVIKGIEMIDMRNMTNNHVEIRNEITLEMGDIEKVSDNGSLYIYGDSGFDEVVMVGDSVYREDVVVGDEMFARYASSNADLFIQFGLSLNGSEIL